MEGYGKVIAIAAVSGFLLSLELRYVFRRLWLLSPQVMVFGALLSCYAFALIWRVIINSAYLQYTSDSMDWVMKSPLEFFSNAMASTYLLLCWTGLYFGFKYYDSLQKQREATLRAASLAQEAQLKMLRYQLNPHFLFNTLNAISTLILDSENRIANQAVMRLSEFLRYTLDQDPMKKVTLRQEIEAMNLYLTTEKLRFGDRLRLEFSVEERALEALVPSLLLQPLIENAVRYAVSPAEQGGSIRVEGRVRGTMLELAVADDGPGLSTGAAPGAGRGVGLRNTRERLAVLYDDNHRFAAIDNKPGLRIELGLPLEMSAAGA
jgi:two-component system LytT family sensor kinase